MIDETLLEAEEKMDKAVEVAKEDFAAIRTGRATRRCSTRSWSTTTAPRRRSTSWRRSTSPRRGSIVITPYDKGSLAAIEKAIRDCDLGVNPTNDGTVIRVAFPQLTEERRREYIKVATAQGRGRPGLDPQHPPARQGQRWTSSSKDGEAGEDDVRRAEKQLDDVTHKLRRADRRPAQAQGSRAARGLSVRRRIADATPTDRRPAPAGPGAARAGRAQPRRRHRPSAPRSAPWSWRRSTGSRAAVRRRRGRRDRHRGRTSWSRR